MKLHHKIRSFLALFLAFFTLSSTAFAGYIIEPIGEGEAPKVSSEMKYLEQEGIFTGRNGGDLAPDESINRAELMTVVSRMMEVEPDPNEYKNCFLDVQMQWFAPHVCYAKEQGWVQGYEDGNFHPEREVSTAEALKIVLLPQFKEEINALGLQEMRDTLEQNSIYNDGYSWSWHSPYVAFSVLKNLDNVAVRGFSSYDLEDKKIKRYQVADLIFKSTLVKQGGWDEYSDYQRDLLFAGNGNEAFVSGRYPCYPLKLAPAFMTDYIKTTYDVESIDDYLQYNSFDEENSPRFNLDGFCLTDDLNHIALSQSIDENGALSQHVIRFDGNENLTEDQAIACEAWQMGIYEYLELDFDDVDPNTLELIDCIYAKDKNRIYAWYDDSDEIDPATFEVITFPFAKDAEGVIFFTDRIPEADLDSFEVLPTPLEEVGIAPYAKDKNNVYYLDEVIENADPETFEVMEFVGSSFFESMYGDESYEAMIEYAISWYAKDKNYIYFEGNPVDDVDASTFELTGLFYGKDKDHVYHLSEPYSGSYFSVLEGADPISFSPIEQSAYGMDNDSIYHQSERIGNSAESVEVIKVDTGHFNYLYYLKAGDTLYLNEYLVEGIADVMDFEVIDKNYGKDSKHVYWLGARPDPETDVLTFPIVEAEIDLESFMPIPLKTEDDEFFTAPDYRAVDSGYQNFYKDKSTIFYKEKTLGDFDLDLATTEALTYGLFQDKNGWTCTINPEGENEAECEQAPSTEK